MANKTTGFLFNSSNLVNCALFFGSLVLGIAAIVSMALAYFRTRPREQRVNSSEEVTDMAAE